MYEIKAIVRPERVDGILQALHTRPELPGVTVSKVTGFGRRTGTEEEPGGGYGDAAFAKLETVVGEELRDSVVEIIQEHAHTGRAGDGKIFVLAVTDAIAIRSGERSTAAL